MRYDVCATVNWNTRRIRDENWSEYSSLRDATEMCVLVNEPRVGSWEEKGMTWVYQCPLKKYVMFDIFGFSRPDKSLRHCRVAVHAVDDRNRYLHQNTSCFFNLNLHICSPSGQICGPELTSINTVGVQITSTQRSATLKFTRKMFVLFLMSFPRNTTNGTWEYYTRKLQQLTLKIDTSIVIIQIVNKNGD